MECKPIGVERGAGAEWVYIFDLGLRVERVRQSLMVSPATLMMLSPNADQWRSLFPHPNRRAKFDGLAAGGWLMRECWAAELRRTSANATPSSA